jgi:pyrimidine operon attenuation protein / uracil phosphoribosyltransferase
VTARHFCAVKKYLPDWHKTKKSPFYYAWLLGILERGMKKLELLMDATALDRALARISHQILERFPNLDNIGIVGMQTRGVFLAKRIVVKLNELAAVSMSAGVLDVTLYRDDYRAPFRQPRVQVTDIPFDINGRDIILVDDVLYTGRTTRAALDALMDFGRPQTIQLAVLVDRGHRELPIRADYVGKKITTLTNQEVALKVLEIDGEDSLWLTEISKGD